MPDYKEMYLKLFNSITNAIEILQQAQIETEEIYISSDDKNNVVKITNNEK